MADTHSAYLHEAVRDSLAAGDFETAGQLSGALGQAIMQEALAHAPGDRAALLAENLARLEEHLSLARVLRAHVAGHLQTNTAVCLYQAAAASDHCWGFDA